MTHHYKLFTPTGFRHFAAVLHSPAGSHSKPVRSRQVHRVVLVFVGAFQLLISWHGNYITHIITQLIGRYLHSGIVISLMPPLGAPFQGFVIPLLGFFVPKRKHG